MRIRELKDTCNMVVAFRILSILRAITMCLDSAISPNRMSGKQRRIAMSEKVSLGQVHEFALTLEKAGAKPEHYDFVAKSLDLANQILALVEMAMKVVFTLVAKIERDMTGWTCEEPFVAKEGEFEPYLQEFLQKGEDCVAGEEMVKRGAKDKTGLRHAEAMLRQQEKIPAEWRKYYLVFPEVWQSPSGDRYVWYLDWSGERWSLHCYYLGRDFGSYDRLVGARKCQKSVDF